MRTTFDDFIDGLTWYLLGPEGRPRDFGARAYDELMGLLKTTLLSERFWGRLLDGIAEWNPSLPPLTSDERNAFTQRAVNATPTILSAMGMVVSDVADTNLDFTRLDVERLAGLYRALRDIVEPQHVTLATLLTHFMIPAAFPANDREVQPLTNEGEFLNNVIETQRLLRLMRPGFVEKLSAVLHDVVSKSDGMAGVSPANFPYGVKLAQLCVLGRAHAGFYESQKDAVHGIEGFGRTMGDFAAFVAGMLNHETGEPQLDDATYHRYAKDATYRVDIRRSLRATPTESDPALRLRLLAARPFLEGALFWLYRCGAPRDFLFQTYQQSALHAQTRQVLSDAHIAVILRGLQKIAVFLSPDLNLEQLEEDLLFSRGLLNAAFLQHVEPYVDADMFWTSISSPNDGEPFFNLVRGLGSITNDADASWVCHLIAPSAFAPLAQGGEHYLEVSGYPAYNARVKDLYSWTRTRDNDPYIAALLTLQYVSAGELLKNFENTDAAKAWPLANLVAFLCINGLSHPGIAQQLAEESTPPLSGLLQGARDFVSSTLYIEGIHHGTSSWTRTGIPAMLDSIRIKDGKPVADRFVVPTELFTPGLTSLELQTRTAPKSSLTFPVRLVRAPGIAANFEKDTQEE